MCATLSMAAVNGVATGTFGIVGLVIDVVDSPICPRGGVELMRLPAMVGAPSVSISSSLGSQNEVSAVSCTDGAISDACTQCSASNKVETCNMENTNMT